MCFSQVFLIFFKLKCINNDINKEKMENFIYHVCRITHVTKEHYFENAIIKRDDKVALLRECNYDGHTNLHHQWTPMMLIRYLSNIISTIL